MSNGIQSQGQIRADLMKAFNGNVRLVRAFENLLSDVSVNIPAAISIQSETDASVISARSFLAQPQLPARSVDESQTILSSLIFGA